MLYSTKTVYFPSLVKKDLVNKMYAEAKRSDAISYSAFNRRRPEQQYRASLPL